MLTISTALWNFYMVKITLNFDNEHLWNCSYPGATFAFCLNGEKLLRQRGLPDAKELVTPHPPPPPSL